MEVTSLGFPEDRIGPFILQFLRIFTKYNKGARYIIQ